MNAPRDYIGFDPVAWVDRLREVNRGSQFPEPDKKIIEAELAQLKAKLTTRGYEWQPDSKTC